MNFVDEETVDLFSHSHAFTGSFWSDFLDSSHRMFSVLTWVKEAMNKDIGGKFKV